MWAEMRCEKNAMGLETCNLLRDLDWERVRRAPVGFTPLLHSGGSGDASGP